MTEKYEIDSLDKKILFALTKDARASFLELARKLKVSGGTIHQRVDKMQAAGVLRGFQAVIDPEAIGLTVSAMVGVHLKNARDCKHVLAKLEEFSEVLEAHYTTGSYALILKVAAPSVPELHSFLMNRLQCILEIQSTETFLCLSTPIDRGVTL